MSARSGKKLSREEYQRHKLVEEQRKAGTIPAEVDVETGKDINPHMPQWMAQAPWYLDKGYATLSHQRKHDEVPILGSAGSRMLPNVNHKKIVSTIHETDALYDLKSEVWRERGQKHGRGNDDEEEGGKEDTEAKRRKNPLALKKGFLKSSGKKNAVTDDVEGASCENCGSFKHITKDCLERPRKNKKIISRGFKSGFSESILNPKRSNDTKDGAPKKKPLFGGKSKKNTAGKTGPANAEEVFDKVELAFEAKRDRWNGYNPQEYDKNVGNFDERQKQIQREIDRKNGKNIKENGDEGEEGDEKSKEESSDVLGGEDKKATGQSLRIREDTAKYLRNLDVDSAHYDPKTRSMREAPVKEVVDQMAKGQIGMDYIGDNFLRHTGDTKEVLDMQTFAWDANERYQSAGVHMESNPTESLKIYKEFQQHKKELKDKVKKSVLNKYGGEEYLKPRPKELTKQ